MVTGIYDNGPLRGFTIPELPDPPPASYFAEELVDEDKLLTEREPTPGSRWETHPYQLVAVDEILMPAGIRKVAHYGYAPELAATAG
jgi:hypothetical protein